MFMNGHSADIAVEELADACFRDSKHVLLVVYASGSSARMPLCIMTILDMYHASDGSSRSF